jgi:hypothetical protein
LKEKGRVVEIQKASQIAKREWGNIRVSLEKCGDIGKFDSAYHTSTTKPPLLSESLPLIKSLVAMENKLPQHGYFTQEAAYVFTTLASHAAEMLGLRGGLAQAFGRGYSWVRTGYLDTSEMEEHYVIKQLFFKGGKKNMRKSNDTGNINEILWEIRRLKEEAEKFSWLLGEELTNKIIEVLEEKENDVIENLMWFA